MQTQLIAGQYPTGHIRVLSVADYNAGPDTGMDVLAGINACVQEALAITNPPPVYFPAGIFLISGTIGPITKPLGLMGAGLLKTRVQVMNGASVDKMIVFGDGAGNVIWPSIEGILFDGNGIANYGIYLRNRGFIRGNMRRVGAQNCTGTPGYGIATEAGASQNYSMTLDTVLATANNIGLVLTGYVQGGSLENGRIFDNYQDGFHLGDGVTEIADFGIYKTQLECDISTGVHVNLKVNGVGCLTIEDVYSESHGDPDSHCLDIASNTLAGFLTQVNINGWYGNGTVTSKNWCRLPSDATRVRLNAGNLSLINYAQELITNSEAPGKRVVVTPSESVVHGPQHQDAWSFATPYSGLSPGTNYAKQSVSLTTTPWTLAHSGAGTNPTVEQSGTGPDGSAQSFLITFGTAPSNIHNGTTLQNMAGVSLTFSIWLRSDLGGPVTMRCYSSSNGTGQPRTVQVGTTWQRYSVTFKPGNTDNSFIYIGLETLAGSTVVNAASVYAFGPQLEQAAYPGPYIPTTTATATLALLPIRSPVLQARAVYEDLVTLTYADPCTLDLSSGNVQHLTLTGSPTLALANPRTGQRFALILTQGAGGSHTVTWWGNIKWPANTPPTLTITAGKSDTFEFLNLDGTNYLAWVKGLNA